MKKTFRSVLLLPILLLLSSLAIAQPGGAVQSINPMTRDLPVLITFAATATGTTNSADQNGFNVSRVMCFYNQTTATFAPSIVISIQNKDAVSGVYYTLLSSAALTTTPTQTKFLNVGAGLQTVANASAANSISRTWRVQVVDGGSAPSTKTGTIGCSVQ